MTLPHAETIILLEEDYSSDDDNNDYDDLPTVRLDEAQDMSIPTVQAEDYSDPDFDDAIEALITNGTALKKAEMLLPPQEEDKREAYVNISISEWDQDEEEEEKFFLTDKVNQRDYYSSVRGEFISASFIRSSKDPSYTLGLKIHPTTFVITHIEPNSPAARSPLRVGDQLVSINHYSCAEMTSVQELRNALQAPGMVTLVVHNLDKKNSAPDVVESMLTKLDVDAKIGIAIKKSSQAYGSVGTLEISSLNPHLGAMHSLFNPTDQVLSINGINVQRFATVQDAVQIISNSTHTVTLKVKTRHDTGVVLGEEEKLHPRTSQRSMNNTFGIMLSKPSSQAQQANSPRNNNNTTTSNLPRWFQAAWQQTSHQQQPSSATPHQPQLLIGTAAA